MNISHQEACGNCHRSPCACPTTKAEPIVFERDWPAPPPGDSLHKATLELLECAKSHGGGSRLLGNVTASNIQALCEYSLSYAFKNASAAALESQLAEANTKLEAAKRELAHCREAAAAAIESLESTRWNPQGSLSHWAMSADGQNHAKVMSALETLRDQRQPVASGTEEPSPGFMQAIAMLAGTRAELAELKKESAELRTHASQFVMGMYSTSHGCIRRGDCDHCDALARAILSREPPEPTEAGCDACCCLACFTRSSKLFQDRMILCPTCGNKRCPKATDHELACTGSNEAGQPGSAFAKAAEPEATAVVEADRAGRKVVPHE